MTAAGRPLPPGTSQPAVPRGTFAFVGLPVPPHPRDHNPTGSAARLEILVGMSGWGGPGRA